VENPISLITLRQPTGLVGSPYVFSIQEARTVLPVPDAPQKATRCGVCFSLIQYRNAISTLLTPHLGYTGVP
jgi:hypothetical protein